MPYASEAQRRFMHAQHPEIAERWDKEYPNQKKLPEKKSAYSDLAKMRAGGGKK